VARGETTIGIGNEGGNAMKKGLEIRSYRDLDVWMHAMKLVEAIYRLARKMPTEERYGMVSQMQRAAVSIPSNIAEGHDRKGAKEFAYHAYVARGSLAELETLLDIAGRLGYLASADLDEVRPSAENTGRLLGGLLRSLEKHTGAKLAFTGGAPTA
jgi:four helix bundle protein